MPNPPMHKYHYPIETEEAKKFWASKHKCNRIKAIIAFSQDIADANFNLRRMGYPSHLRIRALNAYGQWTARPEMFGFPFTPPTVPWWECLPKTPLTPPKWKWVLWADDTTWVDVSEWKDWEIVTRKDVRIDAPTEEPPKEVEDDCNSDSVSEEDRDEVGPVDDQ